MRGRQSHAKKNKQKAEGKRQKVEAEAKDKRRVKYPGIKRANFYNCLSFGF